MIRPADPSSLYIQQQTVGAGGGQALVFHEEEEEEEGKQCWRCVAGLKMRADRGATRDKWA